MRILSLPKISPRRVQASLALTLSCCGLLAGIWTAPAFAGPFTAGDVVIYRIGDGASGLVNTGGAVFLDEYAPDGTFKQSVALPTAVSGANKRLVASGTATSEGLLTLSADGQYLIVTGYDSSIPNAASLSGTTSTAVNRVIGRVDATGIIDTTTALTDWASANNPRSAVSDNGTNIWVGGATGGVRFTTLGGTTSTQVNTGTGTLANIRQVNIFNGQLYYSDSSTSGSNTIFLGSIGTGLPTTAGQNSASILTNAQSGSPYAYFFADLSNSVSGVDTLYVADDGASALRKYSLVSNSWTLNGTVGVDADDYRGLTGSVSGSTVTLFATRKGGSGSTGGGELVKLVDSTGYNGAFSGTPTVLVTAATNTAFRGIALAPVAAVTAPAITTQPSSQSINSGASVTLNVVATGTAPLSYQWYQGNAGDTSTPVGTNSSSFTSPTLSANTNYWVRVTNTAGSVDSTTATVTVSFVAVAPTITSQPNNASILTGSTATLTVAASGTTPLSYQWYQGTSGDTSTPLSLVTGNNFTSSYTTPALSATTSFWVRVSNSAGSVDSTTATVSVSALPKIHDIQGSGSTFNPAYSGTQTIEGIVVRAFPGATKLNGFYIQEEDADADADPTTSEGIFVYDPTGLFTGNVGDKVRVTGAVSEFTSTSGSLSSSLTELTAASVLNLGASTLPTITNVQFPVANVSDLERYEGMLVNISAASGSLTVTEYFQLGRYGQVLLSAPGSSDQPGSDGRLDQYTQFNAPSVSGYAAYLNELAKRQIYLDDASSTQNPDPIIFGRGGNSLSASNTLRGGDTVASITGILDQRFEGYRLQTATGVNFTATNTRPATPPTVGGSLKVGGFNVLNYFNDLDLNTVITTPNGLSFEPRGANTATELTRQRDKIIQAIVTSGADILGLTEMENNGDSSTSAIQDLVNGINAVAGAGTYTFVTPPASVGTDAIKVAFIYKPSKATPIGAAATPPNGYGSGAFDLVGRKPLAQTFQEIATGQQFTAVINHWKSKGSSSGGVGDADALDGQGFSNGTRTREAQDLVTWLATQPTGTTDPDYLILGDLNAYAKEDPLTTLENAGYIDLVPSTVYSYVFSGQLGALDHALASPSLAARVTGADKWHINADEPSVLDYNTEFKSAGQVTSLYNADQFRASDHDPVLVGLQLAIPDLGISLSDAPDPVALGSLLTYTLTVSNSGTANATGVTAQFTLPSGVTLSSTSVSNGFTASQSGNVVTFSGGTINTSASATLTVSVTTTAVGTFTSGVAVVDPSNTIAESNEANNTAAAVSTTVQAPDLSATLSASPNPVALGGSLVYTLKVSNSGNGNASGVSTQFTLPSGVTLSNTGLSNGFTASQSGNVVTFSGGSITAGASATLTVTVTPTTVGTLTSGTVVVDPSNTLVESNEANNTAAAVSTTVLNGLPSLTSVLTVPGNALDLSTGSSANGNRRLGGFGSDLTYAPFDPANNPATNTYVFYGLADRGPGGGVISYDDRVQKFSVQVDPNSGAISNFTLLATINFSVPAGTTLGGQTYNSATLFNGLNPLLLNGSNSILGLSQDPEGFALAPNGNLYVSDEYGPAVYEFSPTGVLVRAFTTPSNLLPKDSTNTLNYVDGRPTITTGRQDNRGFEGLAISPNGQYLYGMLQDPLVNEGSSSDGRNSRNLRIVRFNASTGLSDKQYIYVLDDRNVLNSGLPAGSNTFSSTSQGRNIGISSIINLNDNEFLIIERDNRGFGVGDATYTAGNTTLSPNQVASKRVYKINLSNATDVSAISLANTNTLPNGVVPVTKGATPLLDIKAALAGVNQIPPEKIEGVAVGPQLADGSLLLLVGSDNDFSVTQDAANTQFDVCTSGTVTSQVPIDTACPAGQSLIPSYLIGFKVNAADLNLAAPTLTSATPSNGLVGSSVVLSGTNFARTSGVTFNGVPAVFVANSATQITATVPAGATTGPITVTTAGGVATSPTSFTVIADTPAIVTQPASQTIPNNGTATLSVVATGLNLTYQWYRVDSPTVTALVTGATNDTFITPPLTVSKTYFVRVSNSLGSVDSTTATVTVLPTAPVITTQPVNKTIGYGKTATLTVAAAGSSLSYQWYQGNTGNTATPVGTNTRSFVTPPLTTSTSYWVRVSNGGGSADSTTATVTVNPAVPVITTQPKNQTITTGQTATLTVVATGTGLNYQWYKGLTGDVSTPVGTNSSSFTTPTLTTTTSYWVKVSNAGGSRNSATATVTVGNIAISTQPASQTISSGQTATLSVVASGTGLNYQWYQGNRGVQTTPVGTNSSSFTTPVLTATTTYWVKVSNSAGFLNSNAATVTVTP